MSLGLQKNNFGFLRSRNNESRSLFKKCFKNPLFSIVPFEIWRDLIVSNVDLKTVVLFSQTCWAFKEIVDDIGENNFDLALLLRRECQIGLAMKYLFKCAEKNNSLAMFHLGFAYYHVGWGLPSNMFLGVEWLKKSAECGNDAAIAYYAYFLRNGYGLAKDEELSVVWIKKALSSNKLALAFCFYFGLGPGENFKKAFALFEECANEGDEFAQYCLGQSLYCGITVDQDKEKAFRFLLKASQQGSLASQTLVSIMFKNGIGCEKNEELADKWSRKGRAQEFKGSYE